MERPLWITAAAGAIAAVALVALALGGRAEQERAAERARLLRAEAAWQQMREERRLRLLDLSAEEQAVAASSRNAIVATGMTGRFFDEHVAFFDIARDGEGWTVRWLLTVDVFSTALLDEVALAPGGEWRHAVTDTLQRTRDITATIGAVDAMRYLAGCIGPFEGAEVTYRAREVGGEARLELAARAAQPGQDGMRLAGSVDLETGRCRTETLRSP